MTNKRNEKSAIDFYIEIVSEKEKYKLVNGLFIVKYIDQETCMYFGEFLKAGMVGNNTKTNKIVINPNDQKFNKSKNLSTNARGDVWRTLGIKFIEQPIKEILKCSI